MGKARALAAAVTAVLASATVARPLLAGRVNPDGTSVDSAEATVTTP
jgi:hypothetical protein